jgi:hypothetical protein
LGGGRSKHEEVESNFKDRMDILSILTGRVIFNFIGACIRWTYASIWRTLMNKKKFKFSEYLNGPENTDDWFDLTGHQLINRIIGIITTVLIVIIIIRLGI